MTITETLEVEKLTYPEFYRNSDDTLSLCIPSMRKLLLTKAEILAYARLSNKIEVTATNERPSEGGYFFARVSIGGQGPFYGEIEVADLRFTMHSRLGDFLVYRGLVDKDILASQPLYFKINPIK